MHRSSFEYVHVGTKCIFSLAHRRPFLFPVAGRSSVAGHAGGPRIHTRRTFAPPAGLRGARALGGVQKSLDVASDHGIAFRPAEPSKAMETPKMSLFLLFALPLSSAASTTPALKRCVLQATQCLRSGIADLAGKRRDEREGCGGDTGSERLSRCIRGG